MAGFNYRTAFGVWINDMRNTGMPREPWPYPVLDEQAEKDIINCVRLQSEAGYNIFTVWGLLSTWGWPCDIISSVTTERRERVDRIIKAAHDNGMKIITGVGVYSWGFDEIVKHYPEVAGNNPHAMCASKDASWKWMKKIIDFVLTEFPGLDGIHMESADLGRCSCELCSKYQDIEYHAKINIMVADYVKQNYPAKIVMSSTCGFSRILAEEELNALSEMTKHIDYLIFPRLIEEPRYADPVKRKEFISRIHCDFGSSGGFWIYPPQRWDRMRWFLPHPKSTGENIKELYDDGGRAIEYYMGPSVNPSTEFNIFFGGVILSDPEKTIEQAASESIRHLYKPNDEITCEKLAKIFMDAEHAYISNCAVEMPRIGEIRLQKLFQIDCDDPKYLTFHEDHNIQFMTGKGRKGYKDALENIMERVGGIEDKVGEPDKIRRIELCITNVIQDLTQLGFEN